MIVSQHLDTSLNFAQKIIDDGGIVIAQTDTLFGLVCDATNITSLDKLAAIKCRENGKPFPVFVKDQKSAENITIFNSHAIKLAKAFWPGPLTIILKLRENSSMPKKYFSETIALRVPRNDFLLKLLYNIKHPLTATSANISNAQDPKSLEFLLRDEIFLKIGNAIIDEHNNVSEASTLVDCTTKVLKIIRIGAIKEADILNASRSRS
ncbi:putative YrdC/YwlC family threonylcarbamoyl-AMP synthase [Candidatus Cyrtobacter comes]|uniref:L-threonylcarbamoyladenylate synthase n=1 Tax=Candidatus Cyrtobacter comes TaxID=675776 RepID=A0ABU5L8D7_9RICK|nr:putative YrdC/YwlC family threonylcarbamoyl-AMP synthase [Candidatus Cyrtobacter comes]